MTLSWSIPLFLLIVPETRSRAKNALRLYIRHCCRHCENCRLVVANKAAILAIIQPLSQASQSLASFGSLDSETTVKNAVSIDCTNIAMNYLEDALLAVTVKLVHLGARFTPLDKVKGHCTVTLTNSTVQGHHLTYDTGHSKFDDPRREPSKL